MATKRIVTKIGDVFCAEIDGQYKRFFQYFAIDSTHDASGGQKHFHRRAETATEITESLTY